LTAVRDKLKAGLSATAHQSGDEEGPSASELAEKIKALKAANTIEATPQRVRQKHSTAEEPVTARIRRRNEAVPASAAPGQSDATASAGTDLPPVSTANSPSKPITFQDRLARHNDEDSNLPPL
jgi:hypothetical protein